MHLSFPLLEAFGAQCQMSLKLRLHHRAAQYIEDTSLWNAVGVWSFSRRLRCPGGSVWAALQESGVQLCRTSVGAKFHTAGPGSYCLGSMGQGTLLEGPSTGSWFPHHSDPSLQWNLQYRRFLAM